MMYKALLLFFLLFNTTALFAQKSEQELPEWAEHFIQGKYRSVYHRFSPEMKEQLSFRKFAAGTESVQKSFGSFTGLNLQSATGQQKIYDLYTEKAYFELMVVENNAGISSFFIRPGAYIQPPIASGRSFYRKRLSIQVNDTQSLSAELLLPKSYQRVPVLVLVHGSGASDMDESIGPNKVFKDIALSLAAQGVATLRYDKRTYAFPEWQKSDSLDLLRETIDDAISALGLLETDTSIDPRQIWVLGHSLGGYAVPAILSKGETWAGGVIMGGNSRPVEELIPEQLKYLSMLDGKRSRKESILIKRSEKVRDLIASENWAELQEGLQTLKHLYYWPVLFFKNNVSYEPAALAQEENRPLLILHAKRDYQVDESNLALWKQYLAHKPNVYFYEFEHLNHLFLPGSGEANPMEYLKPGNVSEEVITSIIKIIHGQ